VSHLIGVPFVFTTHASDVIVWKKIPWLGRRIVQATTKRARAFTAVSQATMHKLECFFTEQDWNELEHKRDVIPMGTNIDHYRRPYDQKKLKKKYLLHDHKVLLFIGRLAEKKG